MIGNFRDFIFGELNKLGYLNLVCGCVSAFLISIIFSNPDSSLPNLSLILNSMSSRSFKENDDGTGYDVFARTEEMHFLLMGELDGFTQHFGEFRNMMHTMYWLQGLVI